MPKSGWRFGVQLALLTQNPNNESLHFALFDGDRDRIVWIPKLRVSQSDEGRLRNFLDLQEGRGELLESQLDELRSLLEEITGEEIGK